MKKKANLYYARNTNALVYILYLATKLKDKNKKVLIININRGGCNKEFINSLMNYLNKNFIEIYFINFKRKKFEYGKNFKNAITRSENIKNLLNYKIMNKLSKYKFINAYVGGDDFEVAFYNSLNYQPRFYFVEHGWGNILNFSKKPTIISKLIFNILRLLHYINLLYFYPIKYESYIGYLSKDLAFDKIYINGYKTKVINSVDLKKIYSILSPYLSINVNSIKNKKINLINLSELPYKTKIPDVLKILEIIKTKLNYNKDVIYYKEHPRENMNNKIHKTILNFFKKNKYSFKALSNKKNNFIPIEFFITNIKFKKIFGSLSSYMLACSKIEKKIEFWIPLNTFFKYADSRYGPAGQPKYMKIIKKKFSNINFF